LKQYHAKTSFVKDSFRQEASEGLDFHTSFKFGVNDSNIHTVNVKTNYITKDIVITIFDSLNKQVYSKSFSN